MTYVFKALIYIYRYGLKTLIPQKCCRFTPSCSQYALDALEVYGAWKGLGLILRRLSRCHPWGGHGYDPVSKQKD